MDNYHYYCDKYQSRLNAVGYRIVAVIMPSETIHQLRIVNSDGTKEYKVDANDTMIAKFVDDMQRRETMVENSAEQRVNTINLCIKDYCQTCPYFKEDVEHESLWGNGKVLTGRIYIRCEHRKICARIVTMMKEKNEKV